MAKVDPRLRLVMEEMSGPSGTEFAEAVDAPLGGRIGWRGRADGATIEVLVEGATGADLDDIGTTVAGAQIGAGGSVRSVRLPVTALPALAGNEAVARIEASRPLFPELNWSRRECRAESLHTGSPPVTGSGVVVAVLDSGIDYTHPCFRRAGGGTRIISLWDQGADSAADGRVAFGREYDRHELDRALRSDDPLTVVPHSDAGPSGHGTHVAGIVAGDERGSGLFTGIAPDADLIVVALTTDGASLGTSTQVVAALDHVRQRAGGRPVVVNLSQGTNIGGHSGESLLERRIDELSRQHGFVVVKSAGNEQQWGVHAGGSLSPGEDHFVEFDVAPGNRFDDILEVWFGGGDDIEVSISPPGASPSSRVRPGASLSLVTGAGNQVRIDVDEDADDTGDRRASVILRRGTADQIQPGRWSVVLSAGTIADGRFDAWIERAARNLPGAPEQSRFAPGARDPSRTITIPGTAHRVITAGSYITKSQFPGTIGTLSGFSSLGPTRDGREKPDLAAPGEFITSARAGWSDGGAPQATLMGTSMAAPHVAGAAALVLQAAPLLTAAQVAQVLRRAVRTDDAVGAGPADGWGGGKLDAAQAVELARTAVFPAIVSLQVDGGQAVVKTDIATTARLDTLDSPTATTVHTFGLSGLSAGRRRHTVEVTAGDWTTSDEVTVETAARRDLTEGGVPDTTVRDQDWQGGGHEPGGGPGYQFTVVVVNTPGAPIEYEVTDLRTHERATELDGPALLKFLSAQAVS